MNMMFYEIEHDIGMNHFRYMKKTNMSFPLHMHRCYEMMLMLDGEMTMQIDNIKYSLKTGDLILVKPSLWGHDNLNFVRQNYTTKSKKKRNQ